MMYQDKTELFVQHLTQHQNRLYGYIYSLLGDHSRAADVLQETNLVLWRKAARFQLLAHLRDQQRDRLLLDAQLAETISQQVVAQAEQVDTIRSALRRCMQLLTPANRDLLERRYFHSSSLDEIAGSVHRTVGAIKVALVRIRRQLAECVQKQLAEEG